MYLRDGKLPSDGMHEECGVFGVYSNETRDVAHTAYYGLFALQHRGQESCGIAVAYADKIDYYKGMGLVPEVFSGGRLAQLPEGDIAIGHVRYSTSGASLAVNAQPVVFTGKCGRTALAHNGNLTNAAALREELIRDNAVFQTSVDSEVLALLINKYSDGDIVKGVLAACSKLCGSYALVVMTADKLIAVRDPYGIRPLAVGRALDDVVIASESCALDAAGAAFERDVRPGEVFVVDAKGGRSYFLEKKEPAACIFEYVYFARPDSVIDGLSVYAARREAGRILARNSRIEADVVSGVPDSGLAAAHGYSEVSGIPCVEALSKNRYVGRTFIQPEQGMRESSVGVKLNALRANIEGKRVIIIDDSIVRGTTGRKIVRLLREGGAKEVHMMAASPVVRHPCRLGIDIENYSQLIGANKSVEEICRFIGADTLTFMTVEQLKQSCRGARLGFCTGCFDGQCPYPPQAVRESKSQFD